ncbi:MAG: FAD-dependent oxidoreductase [Chloroflexi bacterium]|nr:FAD-dependent oxidoreductase [Chloroflexota bacterium]
MDIYRYVVVGGGLAGGRACDGIRKVDSDGRVALVTAEQHLPYQRPPLSKGYLAGRAGLDQVFLKDSAFYGEQAIDVLTGVVAQHVEPLACTVTLSDGRVLGYERLLLATGGSARRLPIPGSELTNVFTLRTIDDSDGIRRVAVPGKRAVVLGGSFIGAEVAASLSQLGVKVTVVFPEGRLLERIVPGMLSSHLEAMYAERDVCIISGNRPGRIEGAASVERVILEDGQRLDADLVVMGVGIQLNTELAREAGLEMTEQGAVIVDEYLRTQDPSIYAAGDIAAWPDPTFDRRLRVEHWDVARAQGLRAGRNMAGEEKPYKTLPYFFSDLFDLSFEAWGDLTNWDRIVERGSIDDGSFALYYFERGRTVGVLAAGRPSSERKPMMALVKARLEYEEIGRDVANEASDLASLVE